MAAKDAAAHLRERIQGRVETDWPLAPHTTYRIGGPADLAIFPRDADELATAVRELNELELEWVVLGGGSNVLVSDAGYRGAVLLTTELTRLDVQGDAVIAGAGVDSHDVAVAARDAKLTGAEFLAWLPGSLGGACLMNAKAYGGEISQVIRRASTVTRDGKPRELTPSLEQFAYKQSPFQQEHLIVVEAELSLRPGDPAAIQKEMDRIEAGRRANHEMDYPSCGCVFKNDYAIGISTGALIEQCGLKEQTSGAARVSPHHANFVVNLGDASADDVLRVIKRVRELVAAATGHTLELEVQLLGEFSE